MAYLDFELEIGPGNGREYPVRVINSPAGQARETMQFPFGELELENKLQALSLKGHSDFFNAYTKSINKAYARTGALFERPFRRVEVVGRAYFKNVVAYPAQPAAPRLRRRLPRVALFLV